MDHGSSGYNANHRITQLSTSGLSRVRIYNVKTHISTRKEGKSGVSYPYPCEDQMEQRNLLGEQRGDHGSLDVPHSFSFKGSIDLYGEEYVFTPLTLS